MKDCIGADFSVEEIEELIEESKNEQSREGRPVPLHAPPAYPRRRADPVTGVNLNDLLYGGHSLNYTGTIHFSGKTISAWKHSAKRRGHKWDVSNKNLEQMYDKQKGICALSGIKMEGKPKSKFRPSIDRKDSRKGYTVNNVQFVCSVINVMKNKLLDREFIDLCKLVVKHNG